MNLQKLQAWHATRLGYVVFALLELAAAYGFASLAIDRGSWWWYVLTVIFAAGFLRNFIKLVMKLSNGR